MPFASQKGQLANHALHHCPHGHATVCTVFFTSHAPRSQHIRAETNAQSPIRLTIGFLPKAKGKRAEVHRLTEVTFPSAT